MTSHENDARHEAMLEFLGCFPTLSGRAPTDLSELSDGVALFEALAEISPLHFDPSTIARDLGDNWALKSSNLRKLLRHLETYYHEVLYKDNDFAAVSDQVSDIARDSSPKGICALFELIAAAAVTCDDRAEFVERIMDMSPSGQIEMKGIIESSMERLTEFEVEEGNQEDAQFDEYEDEDNYGNGVHTPSSYKMSNTFSPTSLDTTDRNRSLFRGDISSINFGEGDLTLDIRQIIKERDELQKALSDVKRELTAYKSQESLKEEEAEDAERKLQSLVEDLQDRVRIREEEVSTLEEELSKSKRTAEDAQASLSDLTEKHAFLEDDLDLANAKASQLRKSEATVMAYKRKLESVGVMNQQMSDLEDQAADYLKQIMDLENQNNTIPVLQKKVEELLSTCSKSEKDKIDMDESIQEKEEELDRMKHDLSEAEKIKRMFEDEISEYRKGQDVDHGIEDDIGGGMSGLSLTSAKSISDSKEKSMRLEIKNNQLIKEIRELKTTHKDDATHSDDTGSLKTIITRLREDLKKKEAEKVKLGSDKEKLEAYTKKTLSKFQEKYLVALQECKAKLKEKHDKIEALEMRSTAEKNAQKREERLLSSSIYELGLALMQQKLKDRQS